MPQEGLSRLTVLMRHCRYWNFPHMIVRELRRFFLLLFHDDTRGRATSGTQVQSMPCLLPIMWFVDELIERNHCSYTRHSPVDRHEQCPFDQPILPTF